MPGTVDNIAGTVSFTANTLVGTGPAVTGGGVIMHL